ncbi:MAG TPA: lysylphosphatidylglycerol synthase transmembrane domain-containing protein [Thermoanaerobaculia bacterium]|nr:lysylphosphatidylglycerol synthase transmembrane domain-containing protein [Thermoanaerobaculia bacterium]
MKLAVGAGLLIFLIRRIELAEVLRTIAEADGWLLASALAVSALASVFEVAKFRAACHFRIPYRDSTSLVFIGLFLNNFLPSNIGGDGYKLWALRRRSLSGQAAFAYIVSDRVTGLLSLVLLGGAGFLTAMGSGSAGLLDGVRLNLGKRWIPIAGALALGVALLALILGLQPDLRKRVRAWAVKFAAAGRLYLSVPALPTLAYSLLLHLCRGFALWLICRATGFPVSLSAILQILMLVALVSTIPITLGGLGLREGALAFLLRRCGMSPEAAIAAALISLAVLWLKSLVGAAFFVMERNTGAGKGLFVDDPGTEPL